MNDIFGQALYSYWKGDHRTPHCIRRDDGDVDEGSLDIYFTRRLYPTEKMVSHYIRGAILDVGCGAGRHVLYCQRRGLHCIGIDSSPLAIKVCKSRGCRKVMMMDALHPDLVASSFDTILLFGHNIGIAGTLPRAKILLSALRQLVKKDGVLLLTSIDVTKTKNESHKKYHRQNKRAGRSIGQMEIRIEYKDLIGDWFDWLHIEPRELRILAVKAGWKVQKMYRGRHGEYSALLLPCSSTVDDDLL